MSLDSLKVFWRKVDTFHTSSNYYLGFRRRKVNLFRTDVNLLVSGLKEMQLNTH